MHEVRADNETHAPGIRANEITMDDVQATVDAVIGEAISFCFWFGALNPSAANLRIGGREFALQREPERFYGFTFGTTGCPRSVLTWWLEVGLNGRTLLRSGAIYLTKTPVAFVETDKRKIRMKADANDA